MDSISHAAIRQKNWYEDIERDDDIEDKRFWCMEQEYIFKDIYEPMKKVRPMQAINVDLLAVNNHFEDAIWVTGRMGLQDLMKIQCDYSPDLIKQFFATLAFKNDAEHTMQWMTGSTQCEATLCRFASILGLPREVVTASMALRRRIRWCYLISMTHLELLVLPRGFFLSICACDGDEELDFTLDIMDYIFNEIHDAMVSRTTMPYAPYIQLLINNTAALTEDLGRFPTESQTVKKAYKKKPVPRAAPASGSFMEDALSSSYALGRHVATLVIQKNVKKLSWFQRNVLCMNIEIHKENYEASRHRSDIQHTQAVILHRLSGEQGPPPQPPVHPAYSGWHSSQVPWTDLEQSIQRANIARDSPPAADSDDEYVSETDSE
ncbi:hypothetical protein QYE76_036466 [Lolium multiflorum]|uniref:Uncharacterized protein n=1 Tax=Lolium multiflorum TaxID=4521 RepID=A0AAD8R4Y9_LOLMU|nr:hypothetical protein QYE76_036466 [Lolium multiflorum]